ncbi:MAG TPA: DUF2937 family protein [Methylovirgula sp.]|jgi:hypothetical protein|nr:DUF2937 family protein [Methylovirgula sp.]
MIIRRLALFFAALSGLLTTQMPEYWQQYRQRLEGAIDELAAIVQRFDAEAAQEGLNQSAAIARLEANSDVLARKHGTDIQHDINRLHKLRESDSAFNEKNLPEKWWTLARNLDPAIAARAYETYQPAVPTTSEGFIAGIIGFFIGGALIHILGLPIRYRHKFLRRPPRESADARTIRA